MFIVALTRKQKDGHFHFGYFERHRFKPKQKNHFNGKSYVLIGGNSFSATTLFTNSVIKQDNVTVVGEETGGFLWQYSLADSRCETTRNKIGIPSSAIQTRNG
jgi:Periplasmic protease